MWRKMVISRKFSIFHKISEHYQGFQFITQNIIRKDQQRLGQIITPHGIIHTPAFIFCATKAAMKGVTSEIMKAEQTQIILSNTYHLLLAPGPDIIKHLGGLQRFTGWNGPMLTDSGGYQIFSMGHGSVSDEIKGKKKTPEGWNKTLININEEGATFKSYIDGSIHHLTPELSIDIQRKLGADLIVVLDECTPFNVDKEYTAESMRRSHRWADRSLQQFLKTKDTVPRPQALYGIIQGGVYSDLRKESAEFINNLNVFGIAIGGSLGSNRDMMKEIIEFTCKSIRKDRPVHLLGIGGIADIFHGVRQGIDTFDCVHPSRLGRHGGALVKANYWESDLANIDKSIEEKAKELHEFIANTPVWYQTRKTGEKMAENDEIPTRLRQFEIKRIRLREKELKSELKILQNRLKRPIRPHISLLNHSFRDDKRPIDETCQCSTCRHGYSRGYLHHLMKSDEMIGSILITTHNVFFMNQMMSDIRKGIEEDRLDEIEKIYVHPVLK